MPTTGDAEPRSGFFRRRRASNREYASEDLGRAPRSGRNTAVRIAGDAIGKLASFFLFAAVARTLGPGPLGVYAAAFAFTQVVTVPIDLGFDTHLLRVVSKDRSRLGALFYDTLALKLALTLPVFALAWGALHLLGYGADIRHVVVLLAAGLTADTLATTSTVTFTAFERADLVAVTIVVQRVGAAVLGIGALAMGKGVTAVAVAYTVAAVAGFVLSLILIGASAVRLPRVRLSPRTWPALLRRSAPYAALDVAGLLLARIDAVIIAALATTLAIGRYGAAYRLFESTFLITFGVFGAFAAMYGYLSRTSEPTVADAFARSVKIALTLLMPCVVVLGMLAEPTVRLLFGPGLAGAAGPLRMLAPAAALMGVVTLASYVVVAQRGARAVLPVAGAMVGLNIALNLVLVPAYAERGAAAAMLVTEAAFAVAILVLAVRTVGGVRWSGMLGAPLGAATAMVACMALPDLAPLAALGLGGLAYVGVFGALERVVSPRDFASARAVVRRLRVRTVA